MLIYTDTATGEQLMAKNHELLVDMMNRQSRFPENSNHVFMLAYARRAVLYSDDDIRATDEESFVEDLVRLGHLRKPGDARLESEARQSLPDPMAYPYDSVRISVIPEKSGTVHDSVIFEFQKSGNPPEWSAGKRL